MTDSKRVTREDLAAATLAVEEQDDRLGVVGRGRRVDRIFDALPATPAASGDVEAARAALLDRLQPLLAGEHYEAVRAMMAFEAAIRGEHAGALDAERLARALRNLAPIVYEALPDIARESAEALAAEYARLAEPTP